MINQQLISFIRFQLQQGAIKEKITADLVANGWTTQDVEEGFEAITKGASETMSSPVKIKSHIVRKLFFVVLFLFLIAGGAYAYYFKEDVVNLPFVQDFIKSDILKQIPYIKDLVKSNDVVILQDEIETPETAVKQENVFVQNNNLNTTAQTPTVDNTNNNSFTDCGEIKQKNLTLEQTTTISPVDKIDISHLTEQTKNTLKCFSSLVESCKDGKYSFLDTIEVAVSSKGDSCVLAHKFKDSKKDFTCTFSKTLPKTFFTALFKSKNITSEEIEISKGSSFDAGIIMNLVMSSLLKDSKAVTYESTFFTDKNMSCK